jgi:iron complex outermembrane recepter protein
MRNLIHLLIIFNLISIGNAQEVETSFSDQDIIVTARKKKERLEDIPISIRQFTETEIEDAGIESVRDIAELTPNVTIIGSTSPRYITPYIRGQGNQDLNLPEEISVGFYLDGVPLPRYAFDNELFDIQSVEVLRGPQGTLYGRNSQAGSININTKDPNQNDGHKISAEVGNLNKRAFSGTTNFSLADKKIQNRLSLKYKKIDGYIQDILQNKDLGDSEVKGFNNTLLFTPSDSLKVIFKIGGQKEDGTDPFFVQRGIEGYPKSGQDISPNYDMDLITSSLKAEKDLGPVVLTGIFAFNYYDFGVKYDEADRFTGATRLSGSASIYLDNPNVFYRDLDEMQRQYFTELRVNNKDKDFSWTTGINYNKSTYNLVSDVNTLNGFSTQNIYQDILLDTDSFSIFAEGTKQLPSSFEFTLGARLMHDTKDFDSYHESVALTQYSQKSSQSYTDYSSRASIAYHTSESFNTYFTFARGYQSGGFASYQSNNYRGISADEVPYGDSSSLTYEIGTKGSFLNKRLKVNTALFYNDIKDKQVRVRINNNSEYRNVDTNVYGAEVESKFQITNDWESGLNLGYTNSKFAESVSGNTTLAEGARVKNVPYWMGNLYSQYSHYINPFKGILILRATYKYMGSRFGDNLNDVEMGSYGLWNFRLTFEKERYSLTAYIDNAFDKVYETQAYYYSALQTQVSTPGTPQLYGVKATIRF